MHVVFGHPSTGTEWSANPVRSSVDPISRKPADGEFEQADRALRIALALADESATEALAARLAAAARSRDVFALRGDLGTGKTVFARAFIRARTRRDEEVPSPTFTLVQTYEPASLTEPAIWHYDLFRLQNADDALELDIEEAFCGAISLIEWPERLGNWLPDRRLDLTLSPGATDGSRRVLIEGNADWRCRLREAGIA